MGKNRVGRIGLVIGGVVAAVAVVLLLVLPEKTGIPDPGKTEQTAPAANAGSAAPASAPAGSAEPMPPAYAKLPRASVTAGPRGIVDLVAPKGAVIEPVTGADGVPVVRLSGVAADSPPAGRPGIFLPLAPAFERVASGNTVRVTVTARSAANDPSPAFAVAYSTADVGNSGWQPFRPTNTLAPYSFTYAVPPLKRGQGDYVGILTHPADADGAIEVSAISVEVLPPGTAP